MVSRRWIVAVALGVALTGCSVLQQVGALRQVAFALGAIRSGRLAGVDLSRIANYGSLSATDLGRISLALARKDLPLEFTAEVRAENPADNQVTATMVRMDWSLFLDDRETIAGVVDTSITLPPGTPVIIPMRMRLNLLQFFDGPAQSVVDLAAAVAGLNTDPTRVAIRAVPTINTRYGAIRYPSPITIVSQTVGGSR